MGFDVTEKYIQLAEKELGVTFPTQYRNRLMRENGGEIEQYEDWFLLPVLDTSDKKRLSRSCSDICRETKQAICDGGLPEDSIIIANNGDGDYLILIKDPSQPGGVDKKIYYWGHEVGEPIVWAESDGVFADYIHPDFWSEQLSAHYKKLIIDIIETGICYVLANENKEPMLVNGNVSDTRAILPIWSNKYDAHHFQEYNDIKEYHVSSLPFELLPEKLHTSLEYGTFIGLNWTQAQVENQYAEFFLQDLIRYYFSKECKNYNAITGSKLLLSAVAFNLSFHIDETRKNLLNAKEEDVAAAHLMKQRMRFAEELLLICNIDQKSFSDRL